MGAVLGFGLPGLHCDDLTAVIRKSVRHFGADSGFPLLCIPALPAVQEQIPAISAVAVLAVFLWFVLVFVAITIGGVLFLS